jgi:hypothetical protein
MLRPAKPRTAGSSVTDAHMMTRTTRTAENARPGVNGWFISSMPSSEMTTVMPANITARPAVAIEVSTARRGSWPSARLLRNRVTMNRA